MGGKAATGSSKQVGKRASFKSVEVTMNRIRSLFLGELCFRCGAVHRRAPRDADMSRDDR
jgi:hypothetical protein